MNRMRNEMIHLRALVASQQNLITSLAAENQSLRRSKYAVEKEFLEYEIFYLLSPLLPGDTCSVFDCIFTSVWRKMCTVAAMYRVRTVLENP